MGKQQKPPDPIKVKYGDKRTNIINILFIEIYNTDYWLLVLYI